MYMLRVRVNRVWPGTEWDSTAGEGLKSYYVLKIRLSPQMQGISLFYPCSVYRALATLQEEVRIRSSLRFSKMTE